VDRTEIDLAEEKSRAQHYAPVAVALWMAYAVVAYGLGSHPIASGFLMLGAAAASGMFLFHGLTFAMSQLPSWQRNIAQVIVIAVLLHSWPATSFRPAYRHPRPSRDSQVGARWRPSHSLGMCISSLPAFSTAGCGSEVSSSAALSCSPSAGWAPTTFT
jgi:hypothetical protein